jgi:predicted transposase YdaD
VILPEREVGTAARVILADTQTEAEFRRRLDLVEAILVNKFPRLSVGEVRQMLDLREANLTLRDLCENKIPANFWLST